MEYFNNTFKGYRSLQYSIWAKSLKKSSTFSNLDEKHEYLKEIQSKLRDLIYK
jgi:hypothetical protein